MTGGREAIDCLNFCSIVLYSESTIMFTMCHNEVFFCFRVSKQASIQACEALNLVTCTGSNCSSFSNAVTLLHLPANLFNYLITIDNEDVSLHNLPNTLSRRR